MAVAVTLQHFLEHNRIDYDLVKHPYADDSLGAAECAHIAPEKIAKCVILEDEGGYVMAVCPASHRIKLGKLYREINRRLDFASEDELADLFGDCVLGAIPPVGDAYDVEVVVDDGLFEGSDVYFEAGDHEELIHVSAEAFERLMRHADHAPFSQPA